MPHERILDGRYEVGGLIGRGGMADVFQGRDSRLGRRVAIKMMRPDLARDPQFKSRFRREATSSAALNHPNIVSVFDTGEERFRDGAYQTVTCPFLVMEFVAGRTLQDELRRAEITVERAVEWTSGVLEALAYSHDEGIVHRDIKPANVMVTSSGAVKVMDFGIARALADSAATMTHTQSVVGTALYLSPEQARGETVDTRSDLYSAGCLLFELLTGRPPFVAESPVAVAYQHVREEPPAPSTLNPNVPPALDAVVARVLAKDPGERFQSGAGFRDALARALRHPDDDAPAAGTGAAATGFASPGTAAVMAGTGSTAADPEHTEAIGPVSGGATEALTAVAPAAGRPTRAMSAVGTGSSAAAGATALSASTPPAPAGESGHGVARSSAPPQEPVPRRRRRRVWIPVLVLVLALAAVAGGWLLINELNRRNLEASQVSVPDVALMSAMDAQNTLTSADLRPILATVHDDEVGRDLAVGTEPAAGTTAQRDQEVTLFISQGPQQVLVPEDLAGQSEATARDTLEELGLSISSVRYVPSADVPRDRLVGTSPGLGAPVMAGSSVELRISSGMVEVPRLVGLTRAEALGVLNGLGLGMAVRDVEDTDATAGTVVGQEQAEGTEVPQNSSVTIEVATAPASPSPAPDSASPAPTASPSDSPATSPSASQTGSPSESPSESASPSPSESASPSPSPSESPSEPASPTPSESPSESASPSPTDEAQP